VFISEQTYAFIDPKMFGRGGSKTTEAQKAPHSSAETSPDITDPIELQPAKTVFGSHGNTRNSSGQADYGLENVEV
jgi:hypothetical protein